MSLLTPRSVQRRLRRSRSWSPLVRIAPVVVAVAVVGGILLARCGSGSSVKPAKRDASTTTTPRPTGLALRLGPVTVQQTGRAARVRRPVISEVLSSAQQYVDRAVLAPLVHGRVDDGYAALFDSGVRRAAVRDGPVLTDAQVGRVVGPLQATATPVHVDALGDPAGGLAYVATSFLLQIQARNASGPISIRRLTELTFAYEGRRWIVTAYRSTVRRSIDKSARTAAARAGALLPATGEA